MTMAAKNDLEHIFYKAYVNHKAGQLFEAKKGYLKILKKKPEWGEAISGLGLLYLDQNQPDKAKPLFEKAAGLNPPDMSACYQLGRLKQIDNDHQGAISIYKQMLEQNPEIGLVWNNLGVAYRETGKPDDAMQSFHKAVRFAPQMAEAWNNLGVALDEQNQAEQNHVEQNQTEQNQVEQNKDEQALNAYQKAIDIHPGYVSAHLNIGIMLQKRERYKEAETHYLKVLEIQPKNEIAHFMRHSIGAGSNTPDGAPVEHVRSIFNQCAQNFESILVEELEYKTPQLLFHLVRPYLSENMEILDLGCGTGLGAVLYQPFAKSLTGVDVSEKMLEKADEKKIYTCLKVFDIMQQWVFPANFDLIYSSDVFVYFGDLDQLIKSAAASLGSGGKIAFSVERLKDNLTNYQLFPSGRYAHSRKYIQACLKRHGLKQLEWESADIRKQSGKPVKGLLVVAEKQQG